ncbi:thioesterase II family protein [Streptomyces sp. NPDC001717]|uniref:thioesterase II family protein n=1 Tax=Streptomyces sp. NPDC001717 TaxID=3364604 RepID=UPI0036CBEFA9
MSELALPTRADVGDRVLIQRAAGGTPRYRLVALHHAGGGAGAFAPWIRHLPPDVELCAVRLPGRESRVRETPYRDHTEAVAEIVDVLARLEPAPWCLYGHSMGGMLAYEVYRATTGLGLPEPRCLVVGATAAPQRRDGLRPRLPDGHTRADLVEVLRDYGGTPAEVFDNDELLGVVLPVLEADFTLFDAYRAPSEALKVRCPLIALAGARDHLVAPDDVAAWEECSEGPFEYRLLDGAGHFFADSHSDRILPLFQRWTRPEVRA